MAHLKFDISKLLKLNDPGRFETLVPDVLAGPLAGTEPAVIVEVGAGTGLFAAEFARRFATATVYAVDMATEMLEWLAANRPEVADGRIVPVLSAEVSVPLPDALADAVFMINLHHELAEPAMNYREAHRLLAPGGTLVVADWAPAETPKGPPLHVRVAAGDLAAMLADAGFGEIEQRDGLPWHTLVSARKLSGRT